MSVDLTNNGFDKNTNSFLTKNLSGYNNKIAFYYQELIKKADRLNVGIWLQSFY